SARMIAIFFPAVDMIGTIAISLVVWLGGAAVIGAEITPGVLAAFVLYIGRFFQPIQDLSRRYDQYQATMVGGERILELLKTSVEIDDHPDAVALPTIQGDVRFDNVNF